jgi:hypothetical protein
LLERDTGNGYLMPEAVHASDEDPSNRLLGSSITYRIAVGPQQGRKVMTLQTIPDCGDDPQRLSEYSVCFTYTQPTYSGFPGQYQGATTPVGADIGHRYCRDQAAAQAPINPGDLIKPSGF